jgi:hypothetical protein
LVRVNVYSRGDCLPDLQLPDDRQLLTESVLIQRLKIDDVVQMGAGLVSRAARQPLGLDVGDSPGRTANFHDLARLG